MLGVLNLLTLFRSNRLVLYLMSGAIACDLGFAFLKGGGFGFVSPPAGIGSLLVHLFEIIFVNVTGPYARMLRHLEKGKAGFDLTRFLERVLGLVVSQGVDIMK